MKTTGAINESSRCLCDRARVLGALEARPLAALVRRRRYRRDKALRVGRVDKRRRPKNCLG